MNPNIKTFQLDNSKKFKEFFFDYSFSLISINRIILDSLFGLEPTQWFQELRKYDYYIFITCARTDGVISTFPFMLSAHVSPYHKHPIFDFKNDFLIPDGNISNTSTRIYYNYCKIELKSRTLEQELNDAIKVTIVYEETPGVKDEKNK